MKLELTLLRTRVARRMLFLFLACAVLPILTLAGITYPVVSNSLEKDAQKQLRDDAKGAGMLTLARLEGLEGMLRWGGAARADTGTSEAGHPFLGVATEHANGGVTVERGQVGPLPALDSLQRARLAVGKSLLLAGPARGSYFGVYLVVPGENNSVASTRRWGLFTVGDAIAGLDLVRDGIGLCIEDGTRPLACNDGPGAPARDAGQLTQQWTIFLGNQYGTRPWTVTVTQPRSDALAPLAEFRRSFILGLLIAMVMVFVLSHVQIRRRMTPLADLEEGTRRLQGGDFSSRVAIESNDEFEYLGDAFNQMATDLELQFTTLTALHCIDHAALQDHTAGAIAAAALRGAPELLGVSGVAIVSAEADDAGAWRLDVVTAHEPSSRLADVVLSSRDIAGLAQAGDHMVIAQGDPWPEYCVRLGELGGRKLFIFPIRGRGGLVGALIACLEGTAAQPRNLLTTGRQLADQLALGLSNVLLLEELDSLSLGALTALARTIDASSPWTAGHSELVTQYAIEIGKGLDFSAADLTQLQQGGLLHDIGKIGVPVSILDKPGPLTGEELAIMRAHPDIGARIVESVPAFRHLVPLVRHHHELLDGSGYPAGLRGDEISDLVRVLTVADVFEALTAHRPYRQGLTVETALDILADGVGKKFDVRAVTALGNLVAAGWTPTNSATEQDKAAGLTQGDERLFLGISRAEQAA